MPVSGPSGTAGITAGGFARLMAAVGPFEPAPHIAIGVSGGADSMALLLLLRDWVRARGGRLLALTVDHRLRAESTAEAQQVGRWVAALGVEHQVLPWVGPKPSAGIQAGARAARLDLLAGAATSAGTLHLALAHHADDQAETRLLRQERGSGAAGLAGMPAIREMPGLRIIRPLLPVPKAALLETCRHAGQPWVEDPSNYDPRFARARLRLDKAGRGADRGNVPAEQGQGHAVRAHLDTILAQVAASHVRFQAEGWGLIDGALLESCDAETGPAMMSALLRAVGGAPYPPSPASVLLLWQRMLTDRRTGATLGGCRLEAIAGGWRLMREDRNLPAPHLLASDGPVTWDNRFRLSGKGLAGLCLQALDDLLWRQALARRPAWECLGLPASVRRTLPALTEHGQIHAIPHLSCKGLERADLSCHVFPLVSVPAIAARFAVVMAADDII